MSSSPGDDQTSEAEHPPLPQQPASSVEVQASDIDNPPLPASPGKVQESNTEHPPLPPQLAPPGEFQASKTEDPPLMPPPASTGEVQASKTEDPPLLQQPASPGEVQASKTELMPPPAQPIHILISKDQVRISLPLRAALLSIKIRRESRGASETRVAIEAATLVKIVPYMIRHSGCSDADNPQMSYDELKEWDLSVFLNEPHRMLLNMLYSALWLEIPRMTVLIESKLTPTPEKSELNPM